MIKEAGVLAVVRIGVRLSRTLTVKVRGSQLFVNKTKSESIQIAPDLSCVPRFEDPIEDVRPPIIWPTLRDFGLSL